ncbi:MAG: hypothetical protein U5O39_19085 [Gammaproteobacteria bacterium]|nr:hypothetical protein [Gammaproteobacteria bacterium]
MAALETVTLAGVTARDGEMNLVSVSGDIVFNGDASSTGQIRAVANNGSISQAKNTTISTSDPVEGDVTLYSLNGIAVSSIQATGDVTMVIASETTDENGEIPMFSRVNDPIPFGEGDERQDVASENGTYRLCGPDRRRGFGSRGAEFCSAGIERGYFLWPRGRRIFLRRHWRHTHIAADAGRNLEPAIGAVRRGKSGDESGQHRRHFGSDLQ